MQRACGIVVLQRQLPPGVRPRAGTGIRHAVGGYDLGGRAAAPLGAAGPVRYGFSDQGKGRSLGLGCLDSSASQRQPLTWPGT